MIIVSDWPHPQAARVHRRVALPGTGTRPCSAAKRPRARPGQAAPRCPDGPPADAGLAAACGRSRPAPDCHGCSGRGRRTRRAASQSRWPRPGDDPPGTASAAASQTLRPGRPLGPRARGCVASLLGRVTAQRLGSITRAVTVTVT